MSRNPSRDDLRAEREQIKAEIAADRRFIAQSQALITKDKQIYAASIDRVLESRKLLQAIGSDASLNIERASTTARAAPHASN